MNNSLYETAAEKALDLVTELGIKASLSEGKVHLILDRTSMCQNFPVSGDENASYAQVLNFLKEEFSDYCVIWLGRTDEWMSVGFSAKSP